MPRIGSGLSLQEGLELGILLSLAACTAHVLLHVSAVQSPWQKQLPISITGHMIVHAWLTGYSNDTRPWQKVQNDLNLHNDAAMTCKCNQSDKQQHCNNTANFSVYSVGACRVSYYRQMCGHLRMWKSGAVPAAPAMDWQQRLRLDYS